MQAVIPPDPKDIVYMFEFLKSYELLQVVLTPSNQLNLQKKFDFVAKLFPYFII